MKINQVIQFLEIYQERTQILPLIYMVQNVIILQAGFQQVQMVSLKLML